jgi:hypothetical protein
MVLQARGKPFTPGHDPRRNPGGNSTTGTDTLMDVLKRQIPYEKIALAMDKLVDDGDPRTVHYMADRHLGRPAQSIQVSGDPERPLHALIGVVARDLQPLAAPEALPAGEAHCLDDLEE